MVRTTGVCAFGALALACTSAGQTDVSAPAAEAASSEAKAGEPEPAQAAAVAATPPALRVVAVAAGGRTSYALMSDGTVRAWGDGEKGELGRAETSYAATPVEVAGITGATAPVRSSATAR